jgi:hypothetical protein
MNTKDKKNPNNWTPEERGRVVRVFEWLLKEDKKQNPDLYIIRDKDEEKS